MQWILWLLVVLTWSSDVFAQSTRLSNPNLAADNSISSTSKTPVLPCTANASAPSWTEGRQVPCSTDLLGNTRVTETTTRAGEDVLKDVQRVEERWLTMPSGGSTPKISADQLYATGAGVVKSIDCYSDAAATAGTIAVLDSTAAGSGIKIFEFDVLAVAYNPTGLKQDLNVPFSTGLYLDFTTTADMQCTVRYRP